MPAGNPKPLRPAIDRLEDREVPAVVSAQVVGGIFTVVGDDAVNNYSIEFTASAVTVQEVVTNDTRTVSLAGLTGVSVTGGASNDSFVRSGKAAVPVTMFGLAGDDTFLGGPGMDIAHGGLGDDQIFGGFGRDTLRGGQGSDFVHGGNGADVLFGGKANDSVNGGAGTDGISGGAGDDVLIAIDNGITDTLDAGTGTDVLWFDQNGALRDGVTGITGDDFLRAVVAFANGPDKTLNGDEIADPALLRVTDRYEKITGHPLFKVPGGPGLGGIRQNFTGPGNTFTPVLNDSWLLAAAGSMVETFENLIRTNMVDFGDGTYGVRLNGTYIRIDNDLPVAQFGDVDPTYAGLVATNGAWAPLLEKAFATISSPTNPSYALLDRTLTPSLNPSIVFQAFGGATANFQIPGSFISVAQLTNFVASALRDNVAVVLSVTATGAGVPLVPGQSYSVIDFGLDAFGNVANFTLYNPRNIDGGGSTDADPLDGRVTITVAQLGTTNGRLDLGDFSNV